MYTQYNPECMEQRAYSWRHVLCSYKIKCHCLVLPSVKETLTPLHVPAHYDRQRAFSNRCLWTPLFAPAHLCRQLNVGLGNIYIFLNQLFPHFIGYESSNRHLEKRILVHYNTTENMTSINIQSKSFKLGNKHKKNTLKRYKIYHIYVI